MELPKYNYNPLNDDNYKKKKLAYSLIKKIIVICIIIYIIYISILYSKTGKPDLENFEFVRTFEKKGPITINKKRDDGTKLNIYSMIIRNVNNIIFDENENKFKKLNKIINKDPKYLCEYPDKKPSESFKGYYLSCPTHYTISINNTFYGRYKDDFEHCITYPDGKNVSMSELSVNKTCGVEPFDTLKELCEDRIECLIKPCDAFFGSEMCLNTYKYLYVDYFCKKDIVCIIVLNLNNMYMNIFIK